MIWWDPGEERVASRFTDLAALIGYARSVPWSVPEFAPDRMRPRLRELHERCVRDGSVELVSHRFWVVARRPL